MKARVISTHYTHNLQEGDIVEIISNMEADAADVYNIPAGKCFLCKKEDGSLCYIIATNLQLLQEEDNPDYWTRLEHQYAGMAMQGILSNNELYRQICKERNLVNAITDFAHALVEKLKEERLVSG